MANISRRKLFQTAAFAGGASVLPLGSAQAQQSTSSLASPEIARTSPTVWRVQTVWSSGPGLEAFQSWCASIAESSDGELIFEPYANNQLPGELQLYDAVKAGALEAVNPFTINANSLFSAATFLTSYPMGLRNPHEWDVFYYKLGGLEIARSLFASEGMFFVGPVHHGPNIIHSTIPITSIEDFRGRRMRVPGGMVGELFTALGAEVVSLSGPEIVPAFERGDIEIADFVGPAMNYAQGFSAVTNYISMGPPGFMSVYQPVDLMDITTSMAAWNALSPKLKRFVETQVHVYSDLHHAAIQAADQDAWSRFVDEGTTVTRLSEADVKLLTGIAMPIWLEYASRDRDSKRIFDIQLQYMASGSLGYVTKDQIAWYSSG